eukprot:1232917-Lingulodinium_polyedra.AAC.1
MAKNALRAAVVQGHVEVPYHDSGDVPEAPEPCDGLGDYGQVSVGAPGAVRLAVHLHHMLGPVPTGVRHGILHAPLGQARHTLGKRVNPDRDGVAPCRHCKQRPIRRIARQVHGVTPHLGGGGRLIQVLAPDSGFLRADQ